MDSSCLLELPIKGGTFTWSNQRSEEEAILKKLNRILVSTDWSSSFPKAIGVLDAALASDHASICLLLKGINKRYRKEFKFEAKWLLEDDCEEVHLQSKGLSLPSASLGHELVRPRSGLNQFYCDAGSGRV
ncbi:hypothetical protein V6N12_012689 [Hibiscus sabdariffa]|uniref:Reverse transcriptase n=1 Tax=Hibiscus sabdariffa TaxID=183260 RepID=A0ABR2DDB1_9ROSI